MDATVASVFLPPLHSASRGFLVICQCNRIADDPQAAKHRRIGFLLAAFAVILGGIPSLLDHAYRPLWMSASLIAAQILLLLFALRQFSLARRQPDPSN